MGPQMCVCRVEKVKGQGGGLGAEIRRVKSDGTAYTAPNIDKRRTHLNRSLIELPGIGGNGLLEAINKRIQAAGVKRKITPDQTRAMVVYLTGTHDGMAAIEEAGQLDNWAADNLKWLRDTFGAENVVAAELHLDEYTPHIHAVVVPITTEPARHRKTEGEEKYKTKQGSRLSAPHFMTKINMSHWQDTYAAAMAKYGLQRGIKGSQARHQSMNEYYRNLRSSRIPEAEKTLASITAYSARLHAQNTEAKKDLLAAQAELAKAQKRVKGLMTMVSNLEKRADELNDKIAALKTQATADGDLSAAAAKRLRDLEEEEGKTAAALADKNQKLDDALAKLEDAMAKLTDAADSIQAAKAQKAEIDRGIASARRNLGDSSREGAARAMLDKLWSEFGRYQAQLPADYRTDADSYPLLGQFLAAGVEIMQLANNLYAGLVDLNDPTSMGGEGGGSDSDLRWDGRNPDEDDKDFMRRCLDFAVSITQSRRSKRLRR